MRTVYYILLLVILNLFSLESSIINYSRTIDGKEYHFISNDTKLLKSQWSIEQNLPLPFVKVIKIADRELSRLTKNKEDFSFINIRLHRIGELSKKNIWCYVIEYHHKSMYDVKVNPQIFLDIPITIMMNGEVISGKVLNE